MWLRYFDKGLKYILFKIAFSVSWIVTVIKFKMNGVIFKYDFISRGIPIINVNLKGTLVIGKKLSLHSGKYYNMIGRQQQCYLIVGHNANLLVGDNVGISSTAIICNNSIIIEDNVRIGGGTVIYDSDFHSLNLSERISIIENKCHVKTAPVVIKSGAFIGAHSIILKGITIGSSSIIAAGSVVVKSIPDNEIWGGNPAKFIKKIRTVYEE